jgi:hypothetical protein
MRTPGGIGAGAAESGSAFVEAIIAAAIVAMALGATYRVIADSTARDRAAAARRTALMVAQSTLENVGADIPLVPGDTSGQSAGMTWRVEITPYGDSEAANPVGELLRVAVSVSAPNGGPSQVTLQSVRLVPGS